jgi:hypothetical protein
MASPSKESGYNNEYRPLYDVTYGNGTFVAVGGEGLVKYSLTGLAEGEWKDITVGNLNLNSVTFANGKFVAAGDHSTIWYSPDGITWTQAQLSGEADFQKIIFVPEANQGAGQFIAVASLGTIWYSPDGVLWTIATVVNGGETTFVDVTYSKDTYVAVGDDNTASYSIATANEPIGTVWHTNPSALVRAGNPPERIVTHPHAIIYDNNPVSEQFIVVTTDEDPGLQTGTIFYSSDGITWSNATIYDPTGKFILDASYLATVITTDKGLLAISDGSGTDLADAPVNVMDSLYESGNVGSNWTALCGFNGGQC